MGELELDWVTQQTTVIQHRDADAAEIIADMITSSHIKFSPGTNIPLKKWLLDYKKRIRDGVILSKE